MTFHICIPADSRYAHKAVALCRSIEAACGGMTYKIWILCFDAPTRSIFDRLRIRNATPLAPEDLGDIDLLAARKGRTAAEFSWTCKPPLVKHAMDRAEPGEPIAYLDADQFFFSEPSTIFKQLAAHPIGIVPHDFPPANKDKELLVGRFNAGAVFFAKSDIAYRCIARWREQCLDWCYGKLDSGRLGDQMYLDEWPALYDQSVALMRNLGVNIGTWNLETFRVSVRGRRIYLDDAPLVLFHFHRLKMYLAPSGALEPYPMFVADSRVFEPYIQALRSAASELSALGIEGYSLGADPYPGRARILKQRLSMLIRRFI